MTSPPRPTNTTHPASSQHRADPHRATPCPADPNRATPSRAGQPGALQFAHAARVLTQAARALGLTPPGFRCPPRRVGADRTLRRQSSGAVVAVRLRDRPWPAVLADLVEGVVVANDLQPPGADRVRHALWEALAESQATEVDTGGPHAGAA